MNELQQRNQNNIMTKKTKITQKLCKTEKSIVLV